MANSAIQGTSVGVATEAQRGVVNGTDARNLVFGGAALGFRNKIINGDMRIWQRGASFTPTSLTTIYTTDRWACYRPAFAVGLLASKQSASGLANFPNALRVERSTGNAGTSGIYANQSIESTNCISMQGQTVTLSFYARCGSAFSASSSILVSSLITGTGTDESLANTGYTGQASIDRNNTISTSWQYFTQSYTISSSINEITVRFGYTPVGTSAGNDWFEVTGVQLEVGSVATPFEHRPIGVELQLCQRYYYRHTPVSSGYYGFGGVETSTALNIAYTLPQNMRTTPTIEGVVNPSGVALEFGSGTFPSGFTGMNTSLSSSNRVIRIQFTGGAGGVAGSVGMFRGTATNYAEFGLTAEL